MTSEGTSAGSVFQRLYDSEINFSVSCFWDGGSIVRLGDDVNGFTDEEHTGRDWVRSSVGSRLPQDAAFLIASSQGLRDPSRRIGCRGRSAA